ncbi:helix-turn-helix transcriptional regulator [Phenylobacterium sp.]|uniref:helix-turn-helix transcriptional regulator n=1 Tax=Phenylobacterium sp. TaxID=1871053 RepID=UPI003569E47E
MADDLGGYLPGWDPLLTTAEVAALLKFSVRTLEDWRANGQGPSCMRVNGGQVRYYLSAVRSFLAGCDHVAAGKPV